MQNILESNLWCEGITSHNGSLYVFLENHGTINTYLFDNNYLNPTSDIIPFSHNNYIHYVTPDTSPLPPPPYINWKGDLYLKNKTIHIGSPFHFLTQHDNYIYAHFGIDTLCLCRIEIS